NIQSPTPDLAKELGLPDESAGVLVGGVMPGSAADKGGVKDGDVILELNGKKTSDPRNLQLVVAQTPPGSKISLRLLRSEGGRKPAEKTVTITLGELPKEAMAGRGREIPGQRGLSSADALDGVEVADLDARMRRRLDIPNAVRGALVSNVDQDSNAGEAGLRAGDVILEVNRQPVHSADEAIEQ